MDRRRKLFLCLVWVAVLGTAGRVCAHGDSVSELLLKLESSALRASLTLNYRDLSQWVPPGSADYPAAVVAAMRQARNQLLAISYDEDRSIAPTDFSVSVPSPGTVRIDFVYPAPPPGAATIDVRTLHIDRLPSGHHQILTVEDARRPQGGLLIAQEQLGTEQDATSIDIPKITATSGRLRLVSADDKPRGEAVAESPGPSLNPVAPARTGARVLWILSATVAAVILACLILQAVKKPSTPSPN